MKLEDIGFYTLSDKRAKNASATSPMQRCELILTNVCNFKCTYCRGIRKDFQGILPLKDALNTIRLWAEDGLKNIRFSGGEPTLYPWIFEVVKFANECGIDRIAISTNGSAKTEKYIELCKCGVSDFSISLDGCCASSIDKMSGTSGNYFTIIKNIRILSKIVFVTIGMVFTDENIKDFIESVIFASSLNPADIRIISSAQSNIFLEEAKKLPQDILKKYPILKYRIENIKKGIHVRGLKSSDCKKCFLMQDDSLVCGNYHFPCVIYFREGGNPIGKVSESMRKERIDFMETHNTFEDEICIKNCLDVCIDYNNKAHSYLK